MPPIPRPFPRFIADPPHESKPYGRWEERLSAEFAKACSAHADEAGAPLDPETLNWFPERSWGGRVYVPATGLGAEGEPGEGEDGGPIEYFGWVSYERPTDGEPGDLRRPPTTRTSPRRTTRIGRSTSPTT